MRPICLDPDVVLMCVMDEGDLRTKVVRDR
jgi:hypothetical protein